MYTFKFQALFVVVVVVAEVEVERPCTSQRAWPGLAAKMSGPTAWLLWGKVLAARCGALVQLC